MNALVASKFQIQFFPHFTANPIGPDRPKAKLNAKEICQNIWKTDF